MDTEEKREIIDGIEIEEEKDTSDKLLESMLKQEKYAKRGLWHNRIRTILVLILVVALLGTASTINATLHDVQNLTGTASYAVTDLLNTVEELKLKDTIDGIDTMVKDGTTLISEGQTMIENSSENIEQSLKSISEIDFEGLNESIEALNAVSTAIGRLFGYKG